jgi:hypothetical protein
MTRTITAQETKTEMIKAKILELRSALFFSESASLVQLPTHVVSETEIDEKGDIWFVIPKPVQHIDAFDKEIPAKLDFSKKGLSFFVKVTGTAYLITEQAEMENAAGLSAGMQERMKDARTLAVRISIQDADLIDNTPKPTKNWIHSTSMQLSSWFF